MSDVDMKEDYDMNYEDGDGQEEVEEVPESKKKVYVPGVSRALQEGEELEFDPEAYKLFHTFNTNWPCLSFDVVRDNLGDARDKWPMEMYIASGTQAEKPKLNEIFVLGVKNLIGNDAKDDDASSSDDSDDEGEEKEDKQAILHSVSIPHFGDVNRTKIARLGDANVLAVWNGQGKVQLWNITEALNMASQMTGKSDHKVLKDQKPLFSFSGHNNQGYALAWNPQELGQLASGGQDRGIFNYHMQEGGSWVVDSKPLRGHTNFVEDVQWSPADKSILISCSGDQTVRLWDTRIPAKDACICVVENAHDDDVNVLSWNPSPMNPFVLTGGDDAALKIWSLPSLRAGQPVAVFKHHTKPITSVEWHPSDDTTFMASSEDDQVSIWDVAMEADSAADEIDGVPSQLLFLHCGQSEVKEVHWHPQCPGVAISTAFDFNIFKPINC